MELKNKIAMQKVKLRLVELQRFQDLSPNEQVNTVMLVDSAIEIYLEELAKLISTDAFKINNKIN